LHERLPVRAVSKGASISIHPKAAYSPMEVLTRLHGMIENVEAIAVVVTFKDHGAIIMHSPHTPAEMAWASAVLARYTGEFCWAEEDDIPPGQPRAS